MPRKGNATISIPNVDIQNTNSLMIEMFNCPGIHDFKPLEINRIYPDDVKWKGNYEWSLDEYGLLIEWQDKHNYARIFGPNTASSAHINMSDNKVPVLAVCDLSTAVCELLTSKRPDRGPKPGLRAGSKSIGKKVISN